MQTIFGGLFFQQSGWALAFTQEWPAPGMRHQLSVTIPVNGLKLADGERGPDGLGDIALNYRYQLTEEGPGRPAIAPRLTVLCPSGNQGRGLGVGAWGWQMNLPVSKQHRDFYFHGNVGMTWYPRVTDGNRRTERVRAGRDAGEPYDRRKHDLPAAPDAEPDARIVRDVAGSADRARPHRSARGRRRLARAARRMEPR